MGLTGFIITAKLKLSRLNGNICRKHVVKFDNINELNELFDFNKDKNDIMMSWANLSFQAS